MTVNDPDPTPSAETIASLNPAIDPLNQLLHQVSSYQVQMYNLGSLFTVASTCGKIWAPDKNKDPNAPTPPACPACFSGVTSIY